MTTNARPRIVRYVSADEIGAVTDKYFGDDDSEVWDMFDALLSGPEADYAAAEYADAVRTLNTPAADAVADAVEAIIAAANARPISERDMPDMLLPERRTVRAWASRLRRRSPLLAGLADLLCAVASPNAAPISGVRAALDMLADADLVCPGVDAALRPILTRYAALED